MSVPFGYEIRTALRLL